MFCFYYVFPEYIHCFNIHLFQTDASPYQDVVEAKYLAKEAACFTEIGSNQFLMDFHKMVQINTITGHQRPIRRRPQMITADEVLLGTRSE